MRFTEVDYESVVLKRTYCNHKDTFKEFIGMNVKSVEVLDYHYKNAHTAREVLYAAAKRWAPNVTVSIQKGRVFLIRKDM